MRKLRVACAGAVSHCSVRSAYNSPGTSVPGAMFVQKHQLGLVHTCAAQS